MGFGLVAAWAAARLDRVRPVWFAFGAILGPIALVLLWLAPPAWCRVCLVPTRGWLRACWWCGETLRGRARAVAGSIDSAVTRGDRPAVEAPTPSAPAIDPTSTAPGPRAPVDRGVLLAGPRVAARRGRPATSTASRPAPAVAERSSSEAKPLATAVYFSGTSRLQPGGRYGISVDGDRLLVTGPFDPSAVALERPLVGIEASVGNGRLLLTVPDGDVALILVFTAIVGMSVDALAEAILAASTGGQRA